MVPRILPWVPLPEPGAPKKDGLESRHEWVRIEAARGRKPGWLFGREVFAAFGLR